jgi:hypothetical protein
VTGVAIIRVLAGGFAILLMLSAIAIAATPAGILNAAITFIAGAVILIGVVMERVRYRSEAAEHAGAAPGPGGGESTAPGGGFQRTDEVFVDPTSGRRMRVLLDAATGERRYLAED